MFKILTYLYVCFRRRGYFETSTFLKKVISSEVSEDYVIDVLRFMTREELIDGLNFNPRTPHRVRGLKFKAVIAEGIIEIIKKVADELSPPQGK